MLYFEWKTYLDGVTFECQHYIKIVNNKIKKKNQAGNKNHWKKVSKLYTKEKDPRKKELKDYLYYTGSNHQASDVETTIEFVINHIKGEFNYGNDIAESLRDLDTKLWYPTLTLSLLISISCKIHKEQVQRWVLL